MSDEVEFQIEAREGDQDALAEEIRKEFPDAKLTFISTEAAVPQVIQVIVPHGHSVLGMREQLPDGSSKMVGTDVLLHAARGVIASFVQNRI